MTDYSKVPVSYMQEGVKRWVENGIRPGSFLTALFANDLVEAVCRADSVNKEYLKEWALFMVNEMPIGSYGSWEDVRNWEREKNVSD